jgi:hypothetical protein
VVSSGMRIWMMPSFFLMNVKLSLPRYENWTTHYLANLCSLLKSWTSICAPC